jgi:hypothetical protein
MPSDPRVHLALERLAPPIADFRSIVVGALAQAEGFVASVDPDDERAPQRHAPHSARLPRGASTRERSSR